MQKASPGLSSVIAQSEAPMRAGEIRTGWSRIALPLRCADTELSPLATAGDRTDLRTPSNSTGKLFAWRYQARPDPAWEWSGPEDAAKRSEAVLAGWERFEEHLPSQLLSWPALPRR